MKTVMDNAGVAHIWAQQRQEHAHSKSMSFRGAVIYSYRTPIGHIVKDLDGRNVALITNARYSITTSSKHMPAVWRAVRHMKTFCVSNPVQSHTANLAEMVAAYETEKKRLARAREIYGTPEERLRALWETASEYAEAFGLPVPLLAWLKDGEDIAKARVGREAKFNTPEAIAKRAKDKAQREARAEAKVAEEARVRRERMAETIARWMAGESVHAYFDAECGGAALRVVGDELQTSHNARVPLEHAIKAFRFIKLVRERGEGWHHNGHSLRVGYFTVDSIQPNGDFKAGCHDIRWTEVERIARLVGVFDAAPSDAALTLTYSAA